MTDDRVLFVCQRVGVRIFCVLVKAESATKFRLFFFSWDTASFFSLNATHFCAARNVTMSDRYDPHNSQEKHWQNRLLCDEARTLVQVNKKESFTSSSTGKRFLILDAATFGTTRALWSMRHSLDLTSLDQIVVPNPSSLSAGATRMKVDFNAPGQVELHRCASHHYLHSTPSEPQSFAFVYLDWCGTWHGAQSEKAPKKYCHPNQEMEVLFRRQMLQDGAVLAMTVCSARDPNGLTKEQVAGSALTAVQLHASNYNYGLTLRHLFFYNSPKKRGKKRGSPMLFLVWWVFKRDQSYTVSPNAVVPTGVWKEWHKRLANEVKTTSAPPQRRDRNISSNKVASVCSRPSLQVLGWYQLPGKSDAVQLITLSGNGSKQFQSSDGKETFWFKCKANWLASHACSV